MPDEKAPSSGAFSPASLMYFCFGQPMHFCSGVDTSDAKPRRASNQSQTNQLNTNENFMADKKQKREVRTISVSANPKGTMKYIAGAEHDE